MTTVAPAPTRNDAYARAGEWVLQHCDALIAIWDGQEARGTGGTADIAGRALTYGIPRYWIHREPPYTLTVTPGKGLDKGEYRQLDAYNAIPLNQTLLTHAINTTRTMLDHAFHQAGLEQTAIQPTYQRIVPPFVRADLIAIQYQKRFAVPDVLPLFLAALAIGVVAVQSQFFPDVRLAEVGEIILLVTIFVLYLIAKQWRLHEHWITNRFLAERLRSAIFLSMLRTSDRAVTPALGMDDDSERWMRRALDSVWNPCPGNSPEAAAGAVAGLRQFLITGWIEPQIRYQQQVARRSARRNRLIGRCAITFFSLAVLAKVVHLFGFGHAETPESILGPLLITCALVFPALFSAVEGINLRGNYERDAAQARAMAGSLTNMKAQMETTSDLKTLQIAAMQVEGIMQGENVDWLTTMRFYDVELRM